MGKGWFVVHSAHDGHITRISWYSGMVVPISSILGILILHSKNVLGLNDSFPGGLSAVSASF